MDVVENRLEWILFNTRWVLAAFYLVLVVALVCLAWKFVAEFIAEFLAEFRGKSNRQLTSVVLNLIDTTLLANLLLIVIFNGYENFVSKIGVSLGNEDRPRWMGNVDFAELKLKLLGTMVAISAINLLDAFLRMADSDAEIDSTKLGWMIGIHTGFVLTGVLFALSERIGAGHVDKYAKRRNRPLLLVQDGTRLVEEIARAEVTESELQAAIRLAGYDRVEDVRYALLEADGKIHVHNPTKS